MTDDGLRDYLLSFDSAQDDGPVAINASFRRIYAGEFVYVEDPHAPIWRVHPTAETVDTQLHAISGQNPGRPGRHE